MQFVSLNYFKRHKLKFPFDRTVIYCVVSVPAGISGLLKGLLDHLNAN